MVSAMVLVGGGSVLSALSSTALAQQPAASSRAKGMSVAKASAAAERILNVMQSGDARARFAIFSEDLQATSSPALVARVIARQPKVLGWQITSVDPGLDTATVDALLDTARGSVSITLIIDSEGKLAAYQVDESREATTSVAREFVNAVTSGEFVKARRFLSLPMQSEISPGALQAKWLNLQRQTGNFVRTRRLVEAERQGGLRLVLVTMEFTRMADTLFVILDDRNQIVGLDFPNEPALIKPGR